MNKAIVLSVLLLQSVTLAAPTATGQGGAVATVDENATRAALGVLSSGGNAVDAAITAAAAIGVTEPYSCGIGGGGFLVIYDAATQRVTTIDSRETAPRNYTPNVFIGPDGKAIPFDERVNSGLSVGVPGLVAGWDEALRRFGSKPLRELLQPAIDLAENGFTVDQTFFDQTKANQERFGAFSSTRATFLNAQGEPHAVGSTFKNPDLAKTYRLLAEQGRDGFYRGEVASAVAQTVQQPPTVPGTQRNVRKGTLTVDDLRAYQAIVREPTQSTYRGYTIVGMPMPSSGGPTIALALNLLEGYDLSSAPRAEALHRYLEASRLAFADRGAYLGDPQFVDLPLEGLLSKQYAAERRKALGDRAAAGSVPPGDPYPFQNDPSYPMRPQAAKDTEGTSTTHITVSDRNGNIVAYTCTIESTGGSGITVPGYGFLLNNELTDFDAVAPHPNAPEAGKRPRSSMSPTLVFKDGKPVMALGSPGGSTIITTVLQSLVNVLDFGMTLPEAIAAPRATQRNGETTTAEPGFINGNDGQALLNLGHKFTETAEIGAATGIYFHPDGTVTAAAEPTRRGGGSAMVENPR
ncbi:gamma-glutamyltranspeptidase/glutathione hydrolase [Deinobacterium chartae]|uniref:Glutathione hydrolase proenzyme n=1 Tax=Deinobacterium chartae TaxID=521158 RepID=A0A841I5E6_9DEIO|nr:gamma-glutamyltransferase [Deinobacterium chartae]MBB6099660.1 gamma-glutamyltranspeptidase/glutathione hydrolase [Deinobacterium chartae]